MRKALSLIALVVAGFTLAAAPDAARAETLVERSNVRNRSAFAQWTYSDVTTTTFVDIVAAEIAVSPTSSSGAEPFLLVTVVRTDNATGEFLFSGFGQTSQFALQVKGNLSSAHLSAALDLQDSVSGAIEPFTVNLTFTGVGEVFEEKNHFTSNEGGMIVNVFFDGLQRDASATSTVSGLGINFTPVPAAVAFIQKLHSGTVLVTKE